jgi:hypothetical protein
MLIISTQKNMCTRHLQKRVFSVGFGKTLEIKLNHFERRNKNFKILPLGKNFPFLNAFKMHLKKKCIFKCIFKSILNAFWKNAF